MAILTIYAKVAVWPLHIEDTVCQVTQVTLRTILHTLTVYVNLFEILFSVMSQTE